MGVVKTQTSRTVAFNGNTVVPVIVKVDTKRKLTDGEIQLAKLMYKDSIPYDKVWIVRGGLLEMPNASNNAMTPFGSIHLPSIDYDQIPDFSTNKDQNKKRWFIHEMAHVWQYYAMNLSVACKGVELGIRGGYRNGSAYKYDLLGADSRKQFKDFNIEQQADIICHYYLVKYHPKDAMDILGPSLFHQQAQRASVLREFLNNPKNKTLRSTN